MTFPAPLQDLINAFSRLPGIGPKTASRLAFYLLNAPEEASQDLAQSLMAIKSKISDCPVCFNIMAAGREACEVCANPQRDPAMVCVVEEPLDVDAGERSGGCPGGVHRM